MTNAYTYFKYGICEACREKPTEQRHHKFHKTRWAVKKYGKLMDDDRNIQWVCGDCNRSHAGIKLIHWTEQDFIENMEDLI
jgi:hypothetical protein